VHSPHFINAIIGTAAAIPIRESAFTSLYQCHYRHCRGYSYPGKVHFVTDAIT
jgi:hypothetical protein